MDIEGKLKEEMIKGVKLLEEGRYEEALNQFSLVIGKGRDVWFKTEQEKNALRAYGHHNKGVVYAEMSEYRKAVNEFIQARNLMINISQTDSEMFENFRKKGQDLLERYLSKV